MMNKKLGWIRDGLYGIAVLCLAVAVYWFLDFNAPIIRHDGLLTVGLALNLLILGGLIAVRKEVTKRWVRVLNVILSVLIASLTVYSVLMSMVIDYFQPVSLYDQVIFVALAGLVILLVMLLVQAVLGLIRRRVKVRYLLLSGMIAVFLLQFYGLAQQKDFSFNNIDGQPVHVFEAGEGGYDIFRIPSLLVIPAGSTLEDGSVLENDRAIVMAEARRNGSLDHGDIDLVQKISDDGGRTWTPIMIVRQWTEGVGKIGNATPVFDRQMGRIVLLHIAGEQPKTYRTDQMISGDGGLTWSDPVAVYDGLVGPGHGIQILGGDDEGRLVVPGYRKGGSLTVYSDDHGLTWQVSEPLDDGNECQVVQLADGRLLLVVRTDISVAQPHPPLHKIYALSDDGGATWSDLKTWPDIKEPICMSSIVRMGSTLYYSHPDDYYSRGQMTIAASDDGGERFLSRRVIYPGASGYSELGVLSDEHLLLAFENGAIEYDERITVVRVPTE